MIKICFVYLFLAFSSPLCVLKSFEALALFCVEKDTRVVNLSENMFKSSSRTV